VPGHEDIVGNEMADQLAKRGSEHPFTGPEPAYGISGGVDKRAVTAWANRNHKKHWQSTTGLKQAKGPTPGPPAKRMKDLFKLNKDQLRWVVGLFTGHLSSKGTPFQTEIDRRSHL
jgi:ribonuclease HI